MLLELVINQPSVIREVERISNYTGAKKKDDAEAYDRISIVDEDIHELLRFWNESRAELANTISPLLESEGMEGDYYHLKLNVWDKFNNALRPSMQQDLYSYFIYNIIAKWYIYTNKEEAESYALMAMSCLDNVRWKTMRKAFTRKQNPF